MNTEKMLSVVIPVYNERETVLKIIGKVLDLEFVAELIVELESLHLFDAASGLRLGTGG